MARENRDPRRSPDEEVRRYGYDPEYLTPRERAELAERLMTMRGPGAPAPGATADRPRGPRSDGFGRYH